MYQAILGGVNESPNTSGAGKHQSLMGGALTVTNWTADATARQVIPTGGTISALRVELSAAPGAGKSYVFALVVNGISSALTCTISGTDTTGSDVSNSVAVVAGDTVSIISTPSGTPASCLVRWSTIFQGTTAGESICLMSSYTYALGDRYLALQGFRYAYSATEGKVKCPIPTAGTFKKLYIKGLSAPDTTDATAYYRFTLRKNGADTALTVTITGTSATTGNDTVNTVSVVPGDLVDLEITPYAADGSPDGMATFGAGLVFVSDVNGESLLFGGTGSADADRPSVSAVNYLNFSFEAANATEVNVQNLIQECVIKKMYVHLDTAPGASKSYKFDLRVENADSGLSVTISGTNTTGYHLSREDSVSVGDIIGIECTPTGTPAATIPHIGLVLLTSSATTPTVITGQMLDVTGTTATGRGAVTALNGTVSQHGHCWGATTNPTTADSKTTNGALASPSYFTSALTGLTGGQGYYVRAYATNEFGTSYGLNVYFVADSPIQVLAAVKGSFGVVGETWHFVSATGVEKTVTGT